MTAVCDADIALEFTKNFIEEFENETDKKKPAIEQKLTMCAGIAYCNEKFPFHYAVSLAEELCSAAKKHSKNKYVENQEKDIAPSCLMFHNVQSSNFQSWDKFIKDELTIGGKKEGYATEGEKTREIRCDFGPYYLGDTTRSKNEPKVENFINLAKIYRNENSPKGKLREWIKELGMISFNKTFVFYEPADGLSAEEQNSQWRHLTEGWDKWKLNDLGNKGRFSTLRAKQQYILGWDYDAAANKFIVASVPNDVRDYWSVAVFDGDDKMILEEFIPQIGSNLKLKEGRSLGEYYVTGIDAQPDAVYLLSKNFSTILKLNLQTHTIEDAYSFSGAANARALAVKDGKFYVFSREGKENKVFIYDMK